MSWWPRICPVCRLELPERGNRRVYVPWKRGFRLVHAGACFEAIDAQAVLDLATPVPAIDPVLLVRMRRLARKPKPHGVEFVHGSREDLLAVARGYLARLERKPLVGEDAEHGVERRSEQFLELCRRAVKGLHAREVSAAARTELIA